MRHTPGPLQMRDCDQIGDIVVSPLGDYAVATFHRQCNRDGVPTYDAEANARLFIAAPLMLAACEAVLPQLWDGDPRRQAVDPVCIQLRAAIAAAKPEEVT